MHCQLLFKDYFWPCRCTVTDVSCVLECSLGVAVKNVHILPLLSLCTGNYTSLNHCILGVDDPMIYTGGPPSPFSFSSSGSWARCVNTSGVRLSCLSSFLFFALGWSTYILSHTYPCLWLSMHSINSPEGDRVLEIKTSYRNSFFFWTVWELVLWWKRNLARS